ncbi:MAG TPA: 3-oxoacyl-ACP reductase [Planctomycetaceae bacterium]|nr:3-oxoacyl-ACP reductase [Planctomycetaceae bacterium]HCD03623.1 3-oxoacyl-ACP reductase [Planctomycetaceae bacterium]
MTGNDQDRSADFCRLDGMTAVVTGSSSGVGRAIACELARGGARLIVHCRKSVDSAQELVESIRSSGGEAELVVANFSDPAGADAMLESSWRALGRVDVWVNNAGVDLLTGPEAEWGFDEKLAALWEVDVRATIRLAREAGRRMREANGGTVLNIGWDQAERGMEGDSGELFAAAKGAVMSFTRSLALSLAPTVRVNCIAAGWIRTAWGEKASDEWQQRVLDETPLRRWGEPEDIARLARFLVSPDADYLTGQIICANGGAQR